MFKEFIILSSIIIIHELGHYFVSLYYKWNIDKIYLYPFGGNIKYNNQIDKPLKEEFIVLISGPLFQIIYFILISLLNTCNIISYNSYSIFLNYHYAILIFNLLPIFPLDGSKILNLSLASFLPFKISHKITLYISFIILFISLCIFKYISFNINIYLISSLLLIKLIEESRNHSSLFNKFLLERHLYSFNFNKIKTIIGPLYQKMMRNKKHLFQINNFYVTEKEMLKKRFKKQYK